MWILARNNICLESIGCLQIRISSILILKTYFLVESDMIIYNMSLIVLNYHRVYG